MLWNFNALISILLGHFHTLSFEHHFHNDVYSYDCFYIASKLFSNYCSCLVLCITSLCLSPHGPHTVCSKRDERQWMIDAHWSSTHLLCSSGGVFEGCPAPFERCWGVGSCSWDVVWKLCNSQTQLSPALHHLWPFFSYHIKQFSRRAMLTSRGSSLLGFWMPWNMVLMYFFLAPVKSKSVPKWMCWHQWSKNTFYT